MRNLVFSTFLIALYALVELISCDESDAINFLNSFLKYDKWKSFQIANNKQLYESLDLMETSDKGKNYVTKENLSERLNGAMLLVNYLYTDSLIFVTNFIIEQKNICDNIKIYYSISDRVDLDRCVEILKSFIIKTKYMTELYIGVINYIKNLSGTIITDYFILPLLVDLANLVEKLMARKDNVDEDIELIWKSMTDIKTRLDEAIEMYHISYSEYRDSYRSYCSYVENFGLEFSLLSHPLSFTDYLQNKLLKFTEHCIQYNYRNLGFKYDTVNHETIYEEKI